MPIIRLENVPKEQFRDGAIYQTLVGDDAGSTPVRVGVQISPPGYSTGTHSHPYLEIVSVIEGRGEAWIDGEGDAVSVGPGATLVFPAGIRHWFRAIGDAPLKTYGVHASPVRRVERDTGDDV